MTPEAYGLPQGIGIDGRTNQAVPRKIGAYDTEGINGDGATAIPSQLVFFQDGTKFGEASLAPSTKKYGRDTNITSKQGGMAKGERLYAYGMTTKVAALDGDLNSAANAVWFDQIRRLWGISWIEFKLGGDEFGVFQARDIPVCAPRPAHVEQFQAVAADAFLLVDDISQEGMYDLTIDGQPYIVDQQEDFRVNWNMNPQNLMLKLDTFITLRIEGIRLKSLRL